MNLQLCNSATLQLFTGWCCNIQFSVFHRPVLMKLAPYQETMPILHPSSLPHSPLPLYNPTTVPKNTIFFPLSKPPTSNFPVPLAMSFSNRRGFHLPFCSSNDVFEGFSSTHVSGKSQNESNGEIQELGLLGRPSPAPINNGSVTESDKITEPSEEEALAPFLKFFKPRDSQGQTEEEGLREEQGINDVGKNSASEKVSVEYYEPKPGDFVVGVVVSGNENKLDVNVGADLLGTMLTKEVLPLYDKEMDYLLCDMDKDAPEFMVRGKMGIVKNGDAMGHDKLYLSSSGRPIVETGTVLFAEVLGRTLSGRPLLSMRRLFRKVAWHRVRQIEQLSEPIEVRITEWNTGGLLTRIEGLRAFLPKADLMGRINSFIELKENVGRRMHVKITRANEDNNDLILSEREAWESLHLQEGTLLEGTVKKIFPYGAQIRIGETNRSGLLHISNITRGQVTSVDDLLKVDDKVKALVVKSMFPDKISLSTAELESEPGLFISNRERVYSEAELMAKKYKQKLPVVSATRKLKPISTDALPFDDEATMCSNWRWFKFERDDAST